MKRGVRRRPTFPSFDAVFDASASSCRAVSRLVTIRLLGMPAPHIPGLYTSTRPMPFAFSLAACVEFMLLRHGGWR